MTDSKCKSKCKEKIDTEEKTTEIENEVEIIEEEKPKTPSIPSVAKYSRPPAFQKGNTFARGNQNNFKPVQRRAAQRGR